MLAPVGPDVVVAFLSTQIHWQAATDVLLRPSPANGLKRDSLLRLSKLATLDARLVLGRLGRINTEEMGLVNANLKKILRLDE